MSLVVAVALCCLCVVSCVRHVFAVTALDLCEPGLLALGILGREGAVIVDGWMGEI